MGGSRRQAAAVRGGGDGHGQERPAVEDHHDSPSNRRYGWGTRTVRLVRECNSLQGLQELWNNSARTLGETPAPPPGQATRRPSAPCWSAADRRGGRAPEDAMDRSRHVGGEQHLGPRVAARPALLWCVDQHQTPAPGRSQTPWETTPAHQTTGDKGQERWPGQVSALPGAGSRMYGWSPAGKNW